MNSKDHFQRIPGTAKPQEPHLNVVSVDHVAAPVHSDMPYVSLICAVWHQLILRGVSSVVFVRGATCLNAELAEVFERLDHDWGGASKCKLALVQPKVSLHGGKNHCGHFGTTDAYSHVTLQRPNNWIPHSALKGAPFSAKP
jgi:hypothetical protein